MKVAGLDAWGAQVEDRPGAVAEKLNALAGAGVNLEFIISQRGADGMGPVHVYVAPIKGAKRVAAAEQAGFAKVENVSTLRIQGPDKKGLLAKMTKALGDQGLNLIGVTATVAGRQSITHMAFMGAEDAKRAAKILKGVK